jgi:hypothetical protein
MKAVITYRYKSRGICGQTLGADGNGDYAIIIVGKTENIHAKIKELYATMLSSPNVHDVVVVINEEQYSGFPITEISV